MVYEQAPQDEPGTDQLVDQQPGGLELVGGRYRLLEQIGEGGMSRVYGARDRVLDRIVAVKLLREEYGGDPGFVARFYREARAAASLQHPNIVDIYDYGPYNGTYYIAMQYIEGTDLKAILRHQGAFPPREAVEVMRQVLRALGAAHARGIIHRDVKPQNILVRASDGAIKLTDFGVARALDGVDLTTSGAAPGTAHYMAPEQGSGEPVTPATDLYAAGVVFFELLSGGLPFAGSTPMQVMLQHLREPPPPVPNAPPALDRVVRKALMKDPAHRYQSAEEMLAALDTAAAALASAAGSRTRALAPPAAPTMVPGVGQRTLGGRGGQGGAPPDSPTRALPAPAARAYRPDQDRRRPAGILVPVLLAALLLCGALALFGLARAFGGGSPASPTPDQVAAEPPSTETPTPEPAPTETPAPPPVAVQPPTPTSPPTAAPVPPTRTPVPPTATSAPPPPPPPPPPPAPRPTATTAPLPPPPPPPPAPAPAPAPAPPAAPGGHVFAASQLGGAYRRSDGVLYGRQEVALYGAGSNYSEARLGFDLPGGRYGAADLVLVGLDDERDAQTGFQVLVNGVVVFDGPNRFPRVPDGDNGEGGSSRYWGQMAVTIPAGVLRTGQNTIALRNTEPWTGALNVPYILVNEVRLNY